jgi:hypothetical protein
MANKGLMLRITDRQRETWTRAAERAGQSLLNHIRDVMDRDATDAPTPEPGTPKAGGGATLTSVPKPRPTAMGGGGVKATARPHGPACACLACRPRVDRAPDPQTIRRCTRHHALPSDDYSECGAACRTEWGMPEGPAGEAVPDEG